MKEKIKIICLILITIATIIAVWRYWIYTNDYDRFIDKQTESKFEVRDYTD
jgi:regulatory protein YycH of two-component signal transduction system YycFG